MIVRLSRTEWTFSDQAANRFRSRTGRQVRKRPTFFRLRLYRGNMRSRILTCITSAILFAWLAVAVRLEAQEQQEHAKQAHYRVFNLGTLGGSSSSGNTINNVGWAMGTANLAGNTDEHATVWIYGLRFDLGTLGGPNSTIAWPVKNDRGKIAGISEVASMDPLKEQFSCPAFFPITGHSCRGFVWQWGEMTQLPTLGGNNGIAPGVNNRGQVVGWAENAVHDPTCVLPQVLQFEAVIYGPAKGQIQELPPLPRDQDGAATAINDKGQVVGISGSCDVAIGALTAKHAVLWEDGKATKIGTLGGAGWNTPTAINNRGQIVGFSDLPGDVSGGKLTFNFHAFLWTKEGGIQDLHTLSGDTLSEALDINDQGQIVGVSCTANFASCRVFLWQDGVMKDLNNLIPPDSPLHLISAGGINDRGEITGQACVLSDGTCSSETPAFLAIPRWDGDDGEDVSAADEADVDEAPQVVLPENVRQQLVRQPLFGGVGSEPIRPQ